MSAPLLTAGPGNIAASWTAPASSGDGPIDSYELELNLDGSSTSLTIPAPATTYIVQARACPDANLPCSPGNWKTYRLRVRAHNSSGYGAYADYSGPLRPLLSYMQDLSQLWGKLQCTMCHTRQNGTTSVLYLDGSPSSTYSNLISTANVVTNPVSSSHLLTYPSHADPNSHCGNVAAFQPAMLQRSKPLTRLAALLWRGRL